MLIRGGIALIAVATLSLAGCGGGSSATTTSSAAPVAASASSAAAAAKFGETLTKDGVSVTVGEPVAFTPAATSAAGGKMGAGPSSLLQVTVVNGSDKPLNPWGVSLKATSGDVQLNEVHDSENGVLAPTAEVLPGKTLTWKVAFESPPSKPLDVQVGVNFARVGVFSKG